ncbi:hypothetical protein B0J14DRAFT_495492 [Halenospora varia]|nr:hypothetical protein B0J14DRAFT_495492 [Halenospora varia]
MVIDLQKLLEKWSLTLENSLKNLGNRSPFNITAAQILQTQYLVAKVFCSTLFHEHELAYDTNISEFSNIVSLEKVALKAMEGFRQTSSYSSNTPLFSFDLGIMASLFLTACKCRCPIIRRQALDLRQSGIEGAWNGRAVGVAAEWVLREEEGSKGDLESLIADWQRSVEKLPA